MSEVCYQINLQRELGGGEIFTRSFSRALANLGWRSVLLAARGARFWRDLDPPATQIVEVDQPARMASMIPQGATVVMHTIPGEPLARELARSRRVGGFVHMPLYEREPRGLKACRRVFCVSRHVIDSALAKGLVNVHPEPVYGVADLTPRGTATAICSRSPYQWDLRKFRDRLLSCVEKAAPRAFASGEPFSAAPGTLTLGVVSRLTPIKQFPQLFELLAPVVAARSHVRLEIFGSGGYATVRDVRRSLRACRTQVRFWGHQPDVQSVYRRLDYVLSGLPEKEALGLNLIEAQACGTPVLAVDAPPFTETVVACSTGFLYKDPRTDNGADFGRTLDRATDPKQRPDPLQAQRHIERFSQKSFDGRVERALAALVG